MDTTVSVRPARSADIRHAGLVAALAMHDDPFTAALAPEPTARHDTLVGYYEVLAGYAHTHGGRVDVVDEAGYAIWIPSHALASLPADRLRGRCFPHGDAFDRVAAVLGAAHPDTPAHWYLAAIVVAPDRQRRQLGTGLLETGCRRADHDAMPIYLEATTQATARWYARHGFHPHGEPVPVGSTTLWPMWRPARTNPAEHRRQTN